MPTYPDPRRRWFSLFYLIVAGGLLVWGLTWLEPVLHGWLFFGYWFACAMFAVLAFVTSWLDLRALRRHERAQRRALLEQSLRHLADPAAKLRKPGEESKPATPPEKTSP